MVWGYDHPLIKLGNDVLPAEQKLPFDKFGFFVNVRFFRLSSFLRIYNAFKDTSSKRKICILLHPNRKAKISVLASLTEIILFAEKWLNVCSVGGNDWGQRCL